MLEAIEERELIVLDGLGDRIQGTFHRPADWRSRSSASRTFQDRPGVLFLNSLSLPRAASGDSAVHWAGAIAAKGLPSFRIDLPGLGDSEGQSSTDLLDFINAGGLAPAAVAAIQQLVERFGLSGAVLFGHCAGSVSAVYAAAASKNCKGLILLDPYFHLPQAKRPRVREGLSDWARRSAIGGFLSNLYDRARKFLLLLRGSQPPGNANAQLLARWKQLASTGVPILLLKAPGIKAQGAKPRVGEFDYIDHVVKLAGRKSRVRVEFVECADHSFANREGREAVQLHIEQWLAALFPLANLQSAADNAAPLGANSLSAANQDKRDARDSNVVPADRVCALEGR
jgi:pimeloyl-ACP methyl ester carboxylesterase